MKTNQKRDGAAARVQGFAVFLVLTISAMMLPDLAAAKQAVQPERFDPLPLSTDDYVVGLKEVLWVKAPDGADMYVELYRPVVGPKGIPVPDRLPVILAMTPYQGEGTKEQYGKSLPTWRERFVPKGYVFAIGHGYGTGNSEGCLDFYGPDEVAALSAVIVQLGSAPWSNGRVGMLGGSYDGGYAVHAAALASEAAKGYLAAISVDAPAVSVHDAVGLDGVPNPGAGTLLWGAYSAATQPTGREWPTDSEPDPAGTVARQGATCRAKTFAALESYEATGNFSPWFLERTARRAASSVRAATLFFQGFHDGIWNALPPVGFFDQIPNRVPHKLVLGQWGHALGKRRIDYWPMIQAWFDRFLLGLPVDTDAWPQVQVQDSAGGWRTEQEWPATGGPLGQLALSTSGALGVGSPTGSTSYMELSSTSSSELGVTRAVFSTPPLSGPLHLAGHPALDLWVKLHQAASPIAGDAHLSAVLRAFAADGTEITSLGIFNDNRGRTPVTAWRSAQHLDPINDGEFRQMEAVPVPVGEPVHVPMRFYAPVDLVVPTGGKVVIEVAGTSTPEYPSTPSGSIGRVEILHDCAHPSALRFVMPKAEPEYLEVPMAQAQTQLEAIPGLPAEGLRDGGGLATAKVCGKKPLDPAEVLEN